MSFRDLSLLRYYKTYKNDIVKDFYIPALQQAVLYQRAVGFFSSTALIDLTSGIDGIMSNRGEIQFIVSPRLTEEDISAINRGYEKKKVIDKALIRDFKEPENYFQEERLNYLAYLIENAYLDIKVAFTPPSKELGMYHEKVGIITDAAGNKIVFTGSMNETINAFYNNSESIVVFASWDSSKTYVDEMQADFDTMWKKQDEKIEIIDFPDIVKERFQIYRNKRYDVKYSNGSAFHEPKERYDVKRERGLPEIPTGFHLREYQLNAINSWANKGYHGIFDMATGTGKTYTGLGAVVKLFEKKKKLAVIIVCPYQHLVEQWVEDIELFNMTPIIGYSDSKQKEWKKRLENDIWDFSIGVINFLCFVTTNATYSSKFVSKQMHNLGQDTLLIIDEAHNFGAPSLRKCLYPNISYRLALSATIERHGDDEGSQCLLNYFGEKCIKYDLKRAIREKKLTPYCYYPVVVYLDDDELEKYKEISYFLSKECRKDKRGKVFITEKGKKLLLKRARIVAGASGKLEELRTLMQQYKNDSHMLIYCGATRIPSFEADKSERDEAGERQIVAVSKILGNEFNMKVTHFTSNESAEEREIIKRRFTTTDPYQAIVAIKCLDEGVNIPSIKTAFILASTTNPKEYIQRRGRVLRLAKDKPYAVIYDFVTLARPLNEVNPYSSDYNCERTLAKKELLRIYEFGELAKNSRDSDELINDLESAYSIKRTELEGSYDNSEY